MPVEHTLKTRLGSCVYTETQHASTNGNSEHVFALQARQESTALKQCHKYVTDDLVMPSLQRKKWGGEERRGEVDCLSLC